MRLLVLFFSTFFSLLYNKFFTRKISKVSQVEFADLLSQTSKSSLQLAFMLGRRKLLTSLVMQLRVPSCCHSSSTNTIVHEAKNGLVCPARFCHSFPPIFLKLTGPSSIYWPHCNSDRTISLVASPYVPGMSNSTHKTAVETVTVPA